MKLYAHLVNVTKPTKPVVRSKERTGEDDSAEVDKRSDEQTKEEEREVKEEEEEMKER